MNHGSAGSAYDLLLGTWQDGTNETRNMISDAWGEMTQPMFTPTIPTASTDAPVALNMTVFAKEDVAMYISVKWHGAYHPLGLDTEVVIVTLPHGGGQLFQEASTKWPTTHVTVICGLAQSTAT